ncbi:Uncharacterised protein [Mycobacteroides abscessus subsp. abscessus]|nr:Uncharacterised protein [Mycobacteroides abscessus subsp. abscessus]
MLRPSIPVSRRSANRWPRAKSVVYAYAISPNSVSFARRMPSSSVVNRVIETTGPKISVVRISDPGCTSSSTVGA